MGGARDLKRESLSKGGGLPRVCVDRNHTKTALQVISCLFLKPVMGLISQANVQYFLESFCILVSFLTQLLLRQAIYFYLFVFSLFCSLRCGGF